MGACPLSDCHILSVKAAHAYSADIVGATRKATENTGQKLYSLEVFKTFVSTKVY